MKLGVTVEDKVTGFRGVVTAYVEYLTGCNQALVQPPVGDNGAMRDSVWLDVQRLEIDPGKVVITLENGPTPGFDRAPPRR